MEGESQSNDIQEYIQKSYKEALGLKDAGRHIESLKKFDELQQFVKLNGGGDVDSGNPSAEQESICKEIAIICNILAMAHLQSEDFKMSQELLKKAELYTENGNERIRAITYNNFACLFRKTKKLRNALQYLEKALELEYHCLNYNPTSSTQISLQKGVQDITVEQSLVISNPAEIHLNICAILSQMDKHDLALHHAMKALILIQDEMGERLDLFTEQNPAASYSADNLDSSVKDRFNVMICALHNIAVEHEYLKQYTVSLQYYQKSRDLAVKSLGEQHPMTQKMDNVYFEAAEKIQRSLERQYQRQMLTGVNGLKKKAKVQLNSVQNKKKDLSDIINSGLAQMDIEHTYQQQMSGVVSPRDEQQ